MDESVLIKLFCKGISSLVVVEYFANNESEVNVVVLVVTADEIADGDGTEVFSSIHNRNGDGDLAGIDSTIFDKIGELDTGTFISL